MSGYFHRLLARGNGTARTIRPLKQPRFAEAPVAPVHPAALQRMPGDSADAAPDEEPDEAQASRSALPRPAVQRQAEMGDESEEQPGLALSPLAKPTLRRSPEANEEPEEESGGDASVDTAPLSRQAQSANKRLSRQAADAASEEDEDTGDAASIDSASIDAAPLARLPVQRQPAEFREGQAEDDRRPEQLPAHEEEEAPGRVDEPLSPSRLPSARPEAGVSRQSLAPLARTAGPEDEPEQADEGDVATSRLDRRMAPSTGALNAPVTSDAPLMPPQSAQTPVGLSSGQNNFVPDAAGSLDSGADAAGSRPAAARPGLRLPDARSAMAYDLAAGERPRGRDAFAQNPASAQQSSQAQANAQPGIEIHIGRIEIRAEGESTPHIVETSAPTREAGEMRSLNEYIERRNGEAQ